MEYVHMCQWYSPRDSSFTLFISDVESVYQNEITLHKYLTHAWREPHRTPWQIGSVRESKSNGKVSLSNFSVHTIVRRQP